MFTARSPAKINLTLAVGPRRPDGFHDIESLVTLLTLADDVAVWPADALSLACDDPKIPTDDSNLALRAARALASAAGVSTGAKIELAKKIPAGAGLGGGSSNAATTLSLLNQLWRTRLAPSKLAEIGAAIGSDVPLFFHGPVAIVRGRGEVVAPAQAVLTAAVVLVLPALHSATTAVYQAFDALPPPAQREPLGALVQRVSRPNTTFPAGPRQLDGDELMPHAFNDLEPAAQQVTPALRDISERLRSSTGLEFRMSGSGAAYYRLFGKYADRRTLMACRDAIVAAIPGVRVEICQAMT